MCLLISIMLAGIVLLQTGHCNRQSCTAESWVFLGERRKLAALPGPDWPREGDANVSWLHCASCSTLLAAGAEPPGLSGIETSCAPSFLMTASNASSPAGKVGFLFFCIVLPDLQLCGLPMMSCKLACPRNMPGRSHAMQLPNTGFLSQWIAGTFICPSVTILCFAEQQHEKSSSREVQSQGMPFAVPPPPGAIGTDYLIVKSRPCQPDLDAKGSAFLPPMRQPSCCACCCTVQCRDGQGGLLSLAYCCSEKRSEEEQGNLLAVYLCSASSK